MAVIADNMQVAEVDGVETDPSEQIAHLSSRIVILQQQGRSLDRFPRNPDARSQRNILQQQIRTLYQQIFLLEQQYARTRQRSENYLSVALSMAAHAAHSSSRQFFPA
ncbi:hypothetical protein [Herbaspirillum sp. YR522]|uniref:hypothetical protein n=1 Tax=Herbaspirillum sp. YR522 TaxID=1144342 RepID=UPI00026F6DB5|nr:hypothetical protein [Herbaspirillum sp. YR522]EJN08200.1 hypothetical protein PMI40_01416 [Herbaspirillum sp. YR522]